MITKIKKWLHAHPIAKFIYPIFFIVLFISILYSIITDLNYKLPVIIFGLLLLYIFRPHSTIYTYKIENITWKGKLLIAITVAITIIACTAPMNDNPHYSGIGQPNPQNQYEDITESFLNGRLDFNYGDEDEMLNLNNPYSPEERNATGIAGHWDHSYYNNHYYMYFGVVPVFLTYMPYRIITGRPLTAYIGTQIFTVITIIGIFTLFYYLSRKYFKKLPLYIYLLLSVSFSIISVWYSIVHPALYCTAIISAIALAVWSLYFFIRAIFDKDIQKHQTLFLFLGGLLGALTFGCRPTIALFNIALLPLLYLFIKRYGLNTKSISQILLTILPYILVGVSLMLYNYVRFNNPFEFGQTYQITSADQTTGIFDINTASVMRIINDLPISFFKPQTIESAFPYLTAGDDLPSSFSGIFFIFPIFILIFTIFNHRVFNSLKKSKLLYLIYGLIASILVISVIDILWSPFPIERYHLDIYFLISIVSFIVIGLYHQTLSLRNQKYFNFIIAIFSIITMVTIFLLCMNFLQLFFPETVLEIGRNLHLL